MSFKSLCGAERTRFTDEEMCLTCLTRIPHQIRRLSHDICKTLEYSSYNIQ